MVREVAWEEVVWEQVVEMVQEVVEVVQEELREASRVWSRECLPASRRLASTNYIPNQGSSI